MLDNVWKWLKSKPNLGIYSKNQKSDNLEHWLSLIKASINGSKSRNLIPFNLQITGADILNDIYITVYLTQITGADLLNDIYITGH